MSNLYSTHASEFSATRQSPWKGWERVLAKFKEVHGGISSFNVLDIGCGNGRFLEFLVSQEMPPAKYIGIDNSGFLLNVAMSSSKKLDINSVFFNIDLNSNPLDEVEVKTKFDLIVIFGVLHHIENKDTIARILENAKNLLSTDGILALTFWDFMNSEKLKSKITKTVDSQNNNHTMSFGSNGAERFVHFSDEQERNDLTNSLKLEIIDRFFADGANEKLNEYFVFRNK